MINRSSASLSNSLFIDDDNITVNYLLEMYDSQTSDWSNLPLCLDWCNDLERKDECTHRVSPSTCVNAGYGVPLPPTEYNSWEGQDVCTMRGISPVPGSAVVDIPLLTQQPL